jgi:oligopeptide transport system permease protein
MTETSHSTSELVEGSSLWRDAWRRLKKNYAALAGAMVVAFMAACALGYEALSAGFTHFTYDEQHPFIVPKPPGARSIPRDYYVLMDPADALSFEELDLDEDGVLEAREVERAYRLVEFSYIDTDGDGRISYDEYWDAPLSLPPVSKDDVPDCARWEQIKVSVAPIEHADVFACDMDDDGYLPPAKAGKLLSLVTLGEARNIIGRIDPNGDGELVKSEYKGLPAPETNVLGTDKLGRDLLTRLIFGARISLAVGFIATLVSFLIGVTWGATAGFFGGKVDNVMMRIVDIMYGLPFMFLVILLMVVFGQNIYLLFVALGAIQWLTMARIVRGQVISLKGQEFVEAARAIGTPNASIIFTHLIPNALGPIIVYATLTVPAVMLEEAFLSFLGLGIQAPMTSWGALASEGRDFMATAPWQIFYPGLALAVTLLSMNFLGDGLRDALDPQLRKD